jgi:uncharacterized Zn-finger protein
VSPIRNLPIRNLIDRDAPFAIIRAVHRSIRAAGDMTQGSHAMPPIETIAVETLVVGCDGGGGALGHPRVFLNLESKQGAECPYCGRRYVVKEGVRAGGHGH